MREGLKALRRVDPESLATDLPDAFRPLVRGMLARDAATRPSMREVSATLAGIG
jgi:hypothetical protein